MWRVRGRCGGKEGSFGASNTHYDSSSGPATFQLFVASVFSQRFFGSSGPATLINTALRSQRLFFSDFFGSSGPTTLITTALRGQRLGVSDTVALGGRRSR